MASLLISLFSFGFLVSCDSVSCDSVSWAEENSEYINSITSEEFQSEKEQKLADEASAQLAAALKDIPVETIIISVLAPYPAMELKEWADKILMIYSYSPYSFNAVFGALHGEFVPRGTFPLIE